MEPSDNIDDLMMYNLLLAKKGGIKLETFKQESACEKIVPEQDNYTEKHMKRFFCTKTNDSKSVVTEINIDKYNELAENPFFQTYQMKWKIGGAIRNVYDKGILQEMGVFEYNEASFKKLRKKIPNLGEVVRDLTQFYKN